MGYSDWRYGFPSGLDEDIATNVDSVARKVSAMTDGNNHNGARLAIATWLGNTKFIKIFKAISEMHQVIGSMPQSLIKLRDEQTNELLNAVGEKFGEVAQQKIHSAL